MLLGGFLKQMNDTIRYNLNLREKLKRKPTKKFRKAQKKISSGLQNIKRNRKKAVAFTSTS